MKNQDSHVQLFIENKLSRISAALIKRINFPKVLAGKMTRHASQTAKLRPMLSEHDQAEVRQITACVLCATGALFRPLTFDDWKEIFRAVRGPNGLRIDRQSKNQSEVVHVDTLTDAQTAMLSMRAGYGTDDVFWIAKRKAIARRARYARAQIDAGIAGDRKRKFNRAKLNRFLSFLIKGYGANRLGTVEITSGNSPQAVRMAKQFYEQITNKGEAILTAEATRDVSRTLKSFASL